MAEALAADGLAEAAVGEAVDSAAAGLEEEAQEAAGSRDGD